MTGAPAKIYAKIGDNGRTRFQHFCAGCGSPLFTSGEGGPEDWGIRWGSFRQRGQLEPARQIWCRSAAPWINDIRDLPGRPASATGRPRYPTLASKGAAGLNRRLKGG